MSTAVKTDPLSEAIEAALAKKFDAALRRAINTKKKEPVK